MASALSHYVLGAEGSDGILRIAEPGKHFLRMRTGIGRGGAR